jgi:hypothetical protein
MREGTAISDQMEGLPRKQQHLGTHITSAHAPVHQRIPKAYRKVVYKSDPRITF